MFLFCSDWKEPLWQGPQTQKNYSKNYSFMMVLSFLITSSVLPFSNSAAMVSNCSSMALREDLYMRSA